MAFKLRSGNGGAFKALWQSLEGVMNMQEESGMRETLNNQGMFGNPDRLDGKAVEGNLDETQKSLSAINNKISRIEQQLNKGENRRDQFRRPSGAQTL